MTVLTTIMWRTLQM